MKILKYFLILTTFIGVSFSTARAEEISDPQTVNNIALDKYSGKWYEIASYPLYFQKGCICTTAEYTPIGDYIKVLNQCQITKTDDKNSYKKERKILTADGKAFPVEGSNNSKLKVEFFPPFKADYWIIDRDENYSYTVVSNSEKTTLWILSRTPRMKYATYQAITSRLSDKGYDISKLRRTLQHCGN